MLKRSQRRRIRFLRLFLSLVLIWGIPSTALSKRAYKVGTIFAVTGPASAIGEPQRKTVEMIEQWVNAAGGIDGHPLDVIVYDTKGDEEKAALALKKLMDKDGVVAVIGTSQYSVGVSVVPIVGEHKVPFISCTALPVVPGWMKGKSWVFAVKGYRQGMEAIFEHVEKRGIAKIAIFTPTSEFGKRGRTDLIKLAPKYGMDIVVDRRYGPQERNMKAHLTGVKGSGAQAMINWSEGPSQVEICRNWKGLRMKLPLYQGPEFGNKRMVRAAKGKAEGVFCPLQRLILVEKLPIEDPQIPALIAYKYSFEKKFGMEASPSGGYAWDALWMVVEALKVVGPDKKRIRGYLEEHIRNWPGVSGIFNMSRKDHSGLTKEAFMMGVVKKGKWALAD
ncbi:MAG: ABC transporter substrate-binding protein [Deltaproteobacteria bacterium]|nr:ABC transporter substrate-binding protein [Deltaproteobacteria bacterium]